MKLIKLLSLALAISTVGSVFGQIRFKENVAFQTILDQAKSENKLVFMDCYTTWCGPCKWLSKEVFADNELGNVYNAQFVNFKSDMEKGEGLDIAKKYDINAYPTLLWLNGDGEVVFQVSGAMEKTYFMKFAEDVKNEENTLPNLISKYEAGNREPAFLEKLASTANLASVPNAPLYSYEYLKSIPQSEWLPKNMNYIYNASNSFDSEVTQFVIAHKAEITDPNFVEYVLGNCANTALKKAIENKSEAELEALTKNILKYSPEKTEYVTEMQLYFYKATGNRKKLNEVASAELKNSKDAALLNNYAWDRFENETDEKLLREAIVWAERAVKIERDFANTDTLGQLYKKIGNEKKAAKWLAISKELEAEE